MRFWIVLGLLYLITLAAGLGLPLMGRLGVGGEGLTTTLYFLAVAALVLAPTMLVMMTARSLFPNYWWLAHIENKDIYEYDGVYFIGGRATRQQARLTRLVFGLDEKMRRWHLVFGLLAVSLMAPHLMAGYSAWRYGEGLVVNRPLLRETLHASTLSSLPIMQGWNRPWSSASSLAKEVKRELGEARKSGRQEVSRLFRMAQLRLLNAFRVRKGTADPFLYSPGDLIVFNRGEAADAVDYLRRILELPEDKRKGWTRGALALTGFFHMSDQNPKSAVEFLQRALNTEEEADRTGISRHLVLLLAAQAALLSDQAHEAEVMLENLLTEKKLPERVYAQAMEHYAGALYMQGRGARVGDTLTKALKSYTKIRGRAGIARVHLRMAALALEQGNTRDASHELSVAASLANGLQDGFTLNMVQGLSQFFPRVL